jgi:hypothetical protein
MEFYSAIALLRDTDAQSNKLFVFSRQGTVSQGICFKIFKLAKGADPAAKHKLIVFLAGSPNVADLIEHGFLQELDFGRVEYTEQALVCQGKGRLAMMSLAI